MSFALWVCSPPNEWMGPHDLLWSIERGGMAMVIEKLINKSINWSINKMESSESDKPHLYKACVLSLFFFVTCRAMRRTVWVNLLILWRGQNPCRAEPVRLDHSRQTTLPGPSQDQLTPRQPTGVGAEVVKVKHCDIVVICYIATASQYNYTSWNSGNCWKVTRNSGKVTTSWVLIYHIDT